MMYILTQEELDDLQQKNRKITEDAQKVLQDLCTRFADSVTLESSKPWGCIHTKKGGYCDLCPVRDVCPSKKRWSK
jgi:hypothetical protein